MAKKIIDIAKIEKSVSLKEVITEAKKLEATGKQERILVMRKDDENCDDLLEEISMELGKSVTKKNGKVLSIYGLHTIEVTAPKFYNALVKNARRGYGARLFSITKLRKIK